MKLNRIVFMMLVSVLAMSVAVACAAPPTPTPVPAGPTKAAEATTAPPAATQPAAPETPVPATSMPPTSIPAPAATATAVPKGGKLIFGMSYEPSKIDPHITSAYEADIINRLIFDPLVRRAPDGSFHPGLATEWKLSDDGKTYTFQLRRDVTFHDGTPFNAEAVKFSFDRIVDPATKSEQAASMIGPFKSAEVVDDYTVRINLKEPYGPFLSAITLSNFSIVSPAAMKQWRDTFDDHLVGTGPFIFKEWKRKGQVTLAQNPKYAWGPRFAEHQGPAYLEEITIKFIEEATVRIGTLETGETSFINEVPSQDFKRLADNKAYTTYTKIQPGTPLAIAMNVSRPPFDDLKVRQAMEYAINKQAIVDTLFAGLYPLADAPLAPNTFGYWAGAKDLYRYDVAKAKALLDEAGWKVNPSTGIRQKDGKPFSIWWPTFRWQQMNKMAEIVQAQLKEVGVELKVDVVAFPALFKAANSCEHNLVHSGFTDLDPSVLNTVYLSTNVGDGWAFTCTKDKQIDDLLKRGQTTADEKERAAIYTEVQKIVMNQALVIPVRQFTNLFAARAEVKGLQFDPLGYLPLLYDVYIQK